MNEETPRYAQLRDYLRVVRENWLIIAVLTVVAAGAAFAISKSQQSVYQSTATVSYINETYDLTLLGSPIAPTSAPPSQGPLARAIKVTDPIALAAGAQALSGQISPGALAGSVSASYDQKTGLVDVIGQTNDPGLAARIANVFASNAATRTNREARQRFARAAGALQSQLRRVVGRGPDASSTRAGLIDQISRLNFLATTTAPAQVVTQAQPAGTAVSPRPARNMLLAALAGLVIGLIVAFLRDSLDRRLRGSREIQQYLDYRVLGRIRAEAISGGGRNKQVAADVEAFQVVRQNLGYLREDKPLRSIVVTSAVPEEGKSTVAASLAVAIASTGSRTLLLECDLRRPVLAKRFGLSPGPGLAEYLAGTAGLEDVRQRIRMPLAGNNGSAPPSNGMETAADQRKLVCIVAGNPNTRPIELLESDRCRAFLREVSESYDAVILDTPPLLAVADTLALLPNVDGVILVVRSSYTTQDQARAAKEALEGFPPRPTGLVVTGLRARDEGDAYSYAYA